MNNMGIQTLIHKNQLSVFIVLNIITIVVFSFIYHVHYLLNNDAYVNTTSSERITYFDFLHFSLVTQSTVGYGNIIVNNNVAKLLNSLQLILIMLFFII